MKIRLLNNSIIDNTQFYHEFLRNEISESFYSDQEVYLSKAPAFPLSFSQKKGPAALPYFQEAVGIIIRNYLSIDRKYQMNKYFWYSLFLTVHRDYLLENYPEIKESQADFDQLVLRPFKWDNDIYKALFLATYLYDYLMGNQPFLTESELISQVNHRLAFINDYLDLFDDIIKYRNFRSRHFVIKFFEIVQDENWGPDLMRRMKSATAKRHDLTYGQYVIYELNKMYPALMSPLMTKEDLTAEIRKLFEAVD